MSVQEDTLILVDAYDRPVGSMGKLATHKKGALHRAFSVLLWKQTPQGPELLLQRRALEKYHSGGLWANSCCSHPRVGEELMQAASRRLEQELSVRDVELTEIGSFVYRAVFDNGLTEYEFDHVLVGELSAEQCSTIQPDPAEIMDVAWVGKDELAQRLLEEPDNFAVWFFTVGPMVLARL